MDSFAGLDGLGPAPSKKLSLSEQRKAKEQVDKRTVDAFESLDLLGSFTAAPASSATSSPRPTPTPPAGLTSGQSTTSFDEDDIFGIFQAAPPAPAAASKLAATTKPGERQPSSAQAAPLPTRRAAPAVPKPRSEPDAFSDSFDAEPPRASQTRPSTRQGSPKVSDRAVAQLVDMGFEADDGQRALEAMDGQVRGAVNWLMAEAQGLPLPKPKSSGASLSGLASGFSAGDFNEFQASASQFGASMFSKASTLFAKGRKELEKAYSQYNSSAGFGNGNGSTADQPAWMRDKNKYDARKAKFGSEDPELPRRPPPRPSKQTGTPATARNTDTEPSQVTTAGVAASRSSEPNGRPSRADLFRQRQRERRGEQGTPPSRSSPAPSASSTPTGDLLGQTDSTASSPGTGPPAEPAVDLLNLGGSDPVVVAMSSTETDLYTTSRELGSTAFRNGDYEGAVEHYSTALQVVPEGHALRALLFANRAAARLKVGDAKGAFDDSGLGIELLPRRGSGIEVEGKQMSEIWPKLVTRRAQAAEHMEKFNSALQAWQLLLDNGYASPTVLEAKRRCLRALDPEATAKAERPAADEKRKSKRRGWGTTGAMPTSAEGLAALEKVKQGHAKQQAEEIERDRLRDVVGRRVDAWLSGNESDLRTLLATLQNVVGTDVWTPVPSSELVVPKKVRITYMRAVSRTHPDKVPSSAPVEKQMIYQAVFVAIQHAWEAFRGENGL